MPIQPLTPAGVNAKITELYALSNTALFAQADAVEVDFRTWLDANFSLSTPQRSYLTAMNNHTIISYGSSCSLAFRSRLPVTLVWPIPTPGYTKWTVAESRLNAFTNSAGDLETTGSLTFKMEYRP